MPAQARSLALVERILDATAQVLAEVPLDEVSTNKVAKRAGVAVGSIYQYFANKDELLDALVEDRMRRLGAMVRTRMSSLKSQAFADAADAMVRSVISFYQSEPGLVPILTSYAFLHADHGVTSELRAQSHDAARAYLERLDDPSVPDLETAIFITTNVAGIFGALLASPMFADDRRERVVAEVVHMLSLWMATRPEP